MIPYRGRVAIAVLLLIGGAAVEMVGPWLLQIALDRAVPEGDLRLLGWLVAAYAGSLLLGFGFQYAQTLLTTWLGQRVMFDLRTQLFAHLQRLSLRFFDRNPVGRLMTRVTNDVEVLNELFSSGVVTVFGDLFTLVFIVAAMLIMDWRLALVTFTVLPFVFLTAFVFRGLVEEDLLEHPHPARPDQLGTPGAPERDPGGAAVRPRSCGHPPLPRGEPGPSGRPPSLDHLLRALLSGHRGVHRGRLRPDPLVRRGRGACRTRSPSG